MAPDDIWHGLAVIVDPACVKLLHGASKRRRLPTGVLEEVLQRVWIVINLLSWVKCRQAGGVPAASSRRPPTRAVRQHERQGSAGERGVRKQLGQRHARQPHAVIKPVGQRRSRSPLGALALRVGTRWRRAAAVAVPVGKHATFALLHRPAVAGGHTRCARREAVEPLAAAAATGCDGHYRESRQQQHRTSAHGVPASRRGRRWMRGTGPGQPARGWMGIHVSRRTGGWTPGDRSLCGVPE